MAGPDELVKAARAAGVAHEGILEAISQLPRADFVPPEYRSMAYRDRPIPIPHAQTTTQPSLTAMMIEALDPDPQAHALEIGTGYGWQTALMASVFARVWSIDRFEDLVEAARSHLDRHGIENVTLLAGDGSGGLPEEGPFDAILISAAFDQVPDPLISQLGEGGRLVQPVGPGGREAVTVFRKQRGELEVVRELVPARFVRLVGEWGFRDPNV